MRAVMLARLPGKVPHRSMCRSSLTRSSQCRTRRMSAFEDLHAIPPQLLAGGYLARAVHGERLTLAVVEVEPGAELPEHQHDNEQFGIVIEGAVVFDVFSPARADWSAHAQLQSRRARWP